MDHRLNRLEQKIDEKFDQVMDKLHDIDVTLVRNTDSLEIHEKRTTIAEQKLDAFETKLNHVDTHVKIVNFVVLKLIPAIAGCLLFAKKMDWF